MWVRGGGMAGRLGCAGAVRRSQNASRAHTHSPTAATWMVALGIHQDFVSHGVRDKLAIAGRQSVGDSSKRGIKIGMRHAPTFAGAAEVARPAAVDGFGQIRATRGHDRAAKLFLDATAE